MTTQNNETEPVELRRIRFLPTGERMEQQPPMQSVTSRKLDGALKALSVVLLMVIVAVALLLALQW